MQTSLARPVNPAALFVAGLALVAIGRLVRRRFLHGLTRPPRSVGALLIAHYDIGADLDAVPAPRRRRPVWTHAAGLASVVLLVLTSAGAAIRPPTEGPLAGSSLESLRSDFRNLVSELRGRIAALTRRLEQLTVTDARALAASGAASSGAKAAIASDVAPAPRPPASDPLPPPSDASRRTGTGAPVQRSSVASRPTSPTPATAVSQVSPATSSVARPQSLQPRFEGTRSEGLATGEVRPVSALLVRPVLAEPRETASPITEPPPRRDRAEPPVRSEERIEKLVKVERVERLERPSRIEKVEKPERVERIERVEKTERPARIEKVERLTKPEKPVRPGR